MTEKTSEPIVLETESFNNIGSGMIMGATSAVAAGSQAVKNQVLIDLINSLYVLSGTWINKDMSRGDSFYILGSASGRAGRIAELFKDANSSIANSWEAVAEIISKVDTRVQELTGNVVEQLRKFIDTTAVNEEKIQQAATAASDAGADILRNLGL